MSDADPKLEASPNLEALLSSLRGRIVRQLLLYGVGTVLGAAVFWLGFAFLADWGLRVPYAIRIFHGVILVAVVALFAFRDLVRPWHGIPGRIGLALLLERANPELRELLISAVQFQRKSKPLDEADGDGEGSDEPLPPHEGAVVGTCMQCFFCFLKSGNFIVFPMIFFKFEGFLYKNQCN